MRNTSVLVYYLCKTLRKVCPDAKYALDLYLGPRYGNAPTLHRELYWVKYPYILYFNNGIFDVFCFLARITLGI